MMCAQAVWNSLLLTVCLLMGEALMAADQHQTLFDFQKDGAAGQWQAVNDGVMGGISDGRFRITEDKTMEFFGTLSLENNGGFASVRTRPRELNLKKRDTILIRVKGDGREYSLNLYTQSRQTAFSYRSRFQTTKDEWIEIRFPLERFVATSFGQAIPGQALEPSEVNGLGILLGDKKPGKFKLEIDWIKAIRAE